MAEPPEFSGAPNPGTAPPPEPAPAPGGGPWFRTRLVLAVLLLAAAGAVLTSYLLRRPAARPPIAVVSTSIERTASGFVLSRSVGGRMLFRLAAGIATQYREQQRVALQNVDLDLFDPDGRHVDRIAGASFDYDPNTGMVRAQSLVHLDLEAELPPGGAAALIGGAAALDAPVHVAARDLSFNAKSGAGDVAGGLDFRYLDASGTAERAHLDAATDQLTLAGHVRLQWVRPGQPPLEITAGAARFDHPGSRIVLSEQPRIRRGTGWLAAQTMVLGLRPDYSVRQVLARGQVAAGGRDGDRMLAARAGQARLDLLPAAPRRGGAEPLAQTQYEARALAMSGGVQLTAAGPRGQERLAASTLAVAFAPGNAPSSALAGGGARLELAAAASGGAPRPAAGISPPPAAALLATRRGGTATIVAPALAFAFAPPARRGAVRLAAVTSIGRGTASWLAPGSEPERITADRLAVRLDASQRPQIVTGAGAVQLTAAGGRTLSAQRVRASFGADGRLRAARAAGDVILRQGDEEVRADTADFEPAANALRLAAQPASAFTQGQVAAASPALRLSAPEVRQQNGVTEADGGVVAALLPRAAATPNAPPASAYFGDAAQAVNIAAQQARIERNGAAGVFTGAVRLWQGANVLWAEQVAFDRAGPRVTASGGVKTTFLAPHGLPAAGGRAGLAALARPGRRAAAAGAMPVTITAGRLIYSGAGRQASYSDHVQVSAGDATLTAPRLTVELLPAAANAAAPARIQRVIASGGAEMRQPGRQAKAERMVYDFTRDEVTLSGGSPSIFDAELGFLSGSTLTFSPSSDSIRVESGAGARSFGEYRVQK
ncbi:MAG TPA: LptA/OstA family protein [Terriglobales bacterium]|nr:LptA/OstA family protein [Terriglobales bacterium]